MNDSSVAAQHPTEQVNFEWVYYAINKRKENKGNMTRRPLEGVRVLDLTQAYSGPFCTMHLADLGAEVLKIENPGSGGDQTRGWGPFKNDFSAYFSLINRNKKGLTLDMKQEEGKEIFKELIKNADIVCENYKVGTLEKLGFSYEVMKEINPRIIYASISGFGRQGKYATRPCYDVVAQGMSGMMSVTGFPDGPPVKIGPSVGDNYSGSYLSIGILAALYSRTVTGEGSRIDVAMVDTLFSVMENFVVMYTVGGLTPHRAGNIDPGIAPFDSFRGKDADFVMGCGTDPMFRKICVAMGKPELADNPLYSTNRGRCDNYLPGLKAIIEEWSMTKTMAELEEIFVGLGVPFGQIQTIPEIAEHEIIRDRNMLWDVYQPGIDENIRICGSVIKVEGMPDEIQKAAPLLGESNEEIYKSLLGMSDERLAKLKADGVV